MIADLGHELAGTVAKLDQALAMAQSETFDFAVLDVNLDGKEIYPVAEVLAARGIPFVFCTGYGPRRLPERHQSRPILHKPFQRHDLEQIVSQIFPSEHA